MAKDAATSDELRRGVWTAENAAAGDDLRRGRPQEATAAATYHSDIDEYQVRMFHREAEEPTDGEVLLEGSEELSVEAREYEEVSLGCSCRWKEARNRVFPRRIRHDLEKPTDGAHAGGRKRGIAHGGARFQGGFVGMRGSRRLASVGRHSRF
uniref:Uncharacterized protein n=1 Tax=Oryza meridionalis TaxID=40149 RepID=A0A0E0ESX9_9ORYZ